MPSNEVLVKYSKVVRFLEKKEKRENFEQYLPVKVLRKQKLEKINEKRR